MTFSATMQLRHLRRDSLEFLSRKRVSGHALCPLFYSAGMLCFRFGRMPFAIKFLYLASRTAGARARHLLALGAAFEEESRWAEAASAYLRATMLEGVNARAHFLLGRVRLRTGALRYAEASLSRALSLDPECQEYALELGKIYLEQGLPYEAEKVLRQGLRRAQPNLRIHFYLGDSLSKQGLHEEAAQEFSKILPLSAEEPQWLVEIAQWCCSQGRHREAKVYLSHAVTLRPLEEEWCIKLGEVYLELFEYESARTLFERALSLLPESDELLAQLLRVYENLEKWQEVIECHDELQALEKSTPAAIASAAFAHVALDQWDRAVELYKEAAELQPSNEGLRIHAESMHHFASFLDCLSCAMKAERCVIEDASIVHSTALLVKSFEALEALQPFEASFLRERLADALTQICGVTTEGGALKVCEEDARATRQSVGFVNELLSSSAPCVTESLTLASFAMLLDRDFVLVLPKRLSNLDTKLVSILAQSTACLSIACRHAGVFDWAVSVLGVAPERVIYQDADGDNLPWVAATATSPVAENADIEQFQRTSREFKHQSMKEAAAESCGSILWAYTESGENSAYGVTSKRLSHALPDFTHTLGLSAHQDSTEYDACVFFDFIVYRQCSDRVRARYKILRLGGPGPMRKFAEGDPQRLAKVFREFDCVVAVSPQLAEEARRYHNRVVFIPNGLDFSSYEFVPPSPRQEGVRLTAGLIAKLTSPFHKEQKGYFIGQNSCARADVDFLVAGKGVHEIPSEDLVEEFFRRIDVLIHPVGPDKEGSSNVIMEALALGVPVVTTRHAGLHALILNHGVDGLISPRTSFDFARRLQQVQQGAFDLVDLAKRGRVQAERFHDLHTVARHYSALFRSLVSRDKEGSPVATTSATHSQRKQRKGLPRVNRLAKLTYPHDELEELKSQFARTPDDMDTLTRLLELLRHYELWEDAIVIAEQLAVLSPAVPRAHDRVAELRAIIALDAQLPCLASSDGAVQKISSPSAQYFLRGYSRRRMKKFFYDQSAIRFIQEAVPIPRTLTFTQTTKEGRGGAIALEEVHWPSILEAVERREFHYTHTELASLSEALGKWHALDPSTELLMQNGPYWQDRFEKFLGRVQEKHTALAQRALQLAESLLVEYKPVDYLVTHGDLHPSNILFSPSANTFCFIDLEKISLRPRLMEIADFLYMFLGYRDDSALLRTLLGDRHVHRVRPTLDTIASAMSEFLSSSLDFSDCSELIRALSIFSLFKAVFVLDPDWANPGNPDFANRQHATPELRRSFCESQVLLLERFSSCRSIFDFHEAMLESQRVIL